MTMNRPALRRSFVRRVAVLAAVAGLVPLAAVAKLETWREEGSSAFAKGKREGLVVTGEGRLVLGRVLGPEGTVPAARVWGLAAASDGAVYAATGDSGKVFRRGPEEKAEWSVALETGDGQALAVAAGPGGKVAVGTGPSGKVFDLSEPRQSAARPHPDVLYVWSLAFDNDGNLYAATGPKGQLWKRAAGGGWSLAFDAKAEHLLCLAVGADGSVYTAGDGGGVIYRVRKDGRVSVVYDAPQSEVRALLCLPDGTLYAGTAADSSGGASRSGLTLGGDRPSSSLASATDVPSGRVEAAQKPDAPKADEANDDETPAQKGGGGTASPRPISAGDNAVYRISPDGVAREIFRAKALVHALAYRNGRLLVGTGPEGVLYELTDRERSSAPIARLDSGHIVALLARSGGDVLIGTADPGRVVRLGEAHVPSGTLLSEVRDTKLTSRFGALEWSAEEPPGTSVAIQVRSGNVAEPDETWSDWSPAPAGPPPAHPGIPAGRFVQYRVTLKTTEPAATPALRTLSLRFQTANLPPEISKLEAPDLASGDGGTKQAKLNFRWEASDPNGDDLQYVVEIRKEGWPGWVRLTEQPTTDKTHAIETASLPAGEYRVRLTADDRLSNNAGDALTDDRVSDRFLIDATPPSVNLKADGTKVTAVLKDASTRIARASYSVDGKPWVSVFAEDGLFDTAEEALSLTFPDLTPGAHVLVVRASDAAGNVGTADLLLTVP